MMMRAPVEGGKGGAALVIFEAQALLIQSLCILLQALVLGHPLLIHTLQQRAARSPEAIQITSK
jgi:hypothetical protein